MKNIIDAISFPFRHIVAIIKILIVLMALAGMWFVGVQLKIIPPNSIPAVSTLGQPSSVPLPAGTVKLKPGGEGSYGKTTEAYNAPRTGKVDKNKNLIEVLDEKGFPYWVPNPDGNSVQPQGTSSLNVDIVGGIDALQRIIESRGKNRPQNGPGAIIGGLWNLINTNIFGGTSILVAAISIWLFRRARKSVSTQVDSGKLIPNMLVILILAFAGVIFFTLLNLQPFLDFLLRLSRGEVSAQLVLSTFNSWKTGFSANLGPIAVIVTALLAIVSGLVLAKGGIDDFGKVAGPMAIWVLKYPIGGIGVIALFLKGLASIAGMNSTQMANNIQRIAGGFPGIGQFVGNFFTFVYSMPSQAALALIALMAVLVLVQWAKSQ